MTNTAIIYALCDPDTGERRYIGKTNNLASRVRCHRWEAQSSPLHTYKVNWLRSLSSDPAVEILEECALENWEETERRWIAEARARGERLTNFANGGETSPVEGKSHTEETKLKCRAAAIRNGAIPPSRKGAVPWNRGLAGSVKPNRTTFTKGQTPWNKGKKMSTVYCETNRLGHLARRTTEQPLLIIVGG